MKTASKQNKTEALHVRTTPDMKRRVEQLAQVNGVTESIIVEWALERLANIAESRQGRLVCLDPVPADKPA